MNLLPCPGAAPPGAFAFTSAAQPRALTRRHTPSPRTPSPVTRPRSSPFSSAEAASDTDGEAAAAAWAFLNGNGADGGVVSKKMRDYAEVAYLTGRTRVVSRHFPTSMGIDDFLHRLEIALYAYGFNGDNSIAMVNLCRDEITVSLKQKIDQVFGSSFNTNGLGGVLTCGVTGVSAGLSHAPVSRGSGKERYVFFSFPHISIDARGEVGTISRPGRPGSSCACGALHGALVDIRTQGLSTNCVIPGVHEPLDPEFTILKQRLARRLRYEGAEDADVAALTLVDITKVAERTIADDLEYLISHCVDTRKADYAVVTGIQIHNWGARFDDDSPNLEFVAPVSVYVVVNGEKTHINLNTMPSLTPRQVRLLAAKGDMGGDLGGRPSALDTVCNSGGSSTVREIDPPYMYSSRELRARQKQRSQAYAELIAEEGLQPETACEWPSWQSSLRAAPPEGAGGDDNSAIHYDSNFATDGDEQRELKALWSRLQSKYVGGAAGENPSRSHSSFSPQYASGSSLGDSFPRREQQSGQQ